MTDPLPDVWASRDLPILREVCRVLDPDATMVTPAYLADALDMAPADVDNGMRSLMRSGLADAPRQGVTAGGGVVGFIGVSPEAYRIVGLWPTPETALDRMIAALQAIADNTDEDEDTRSRARKILDNLAGAGRQIGVSVAAAVITGGLT